MIARIIKLNSHIEITVLLFRRKEFIGLYRSQMKSLQMITASHGSSKKGTGNLDSIPGLSETTI